MLGSEIWVYRIVSDFFFSLAPCSYADGNSEREALRWIQKYIGAFGGDPTKVTM
jgi:carboxylesterase type B